MGNDHKNANAGPCPDYPKASGMASRTFFAGGVVVFSRPKAPPFLHGGRPTVIYNTQLNSRQNLAFRTAVRTKNMGASPHLRVLVCR